VKQLFLLLALFTGYSVLAQTKITRLRNQPFTYVPTEFYVASVTDDRDDTGNVGHILTGNNRTPVALQDGAARSMYEYIRTNAKQDMSATPMDIHIKQLSVEESKKDNARQVDLKAELEFFSYGNRLNAYTYSSYARSQVNVSDHIGTLIAELTVQCIKDFDTWLRENKQTLKPGISVIAEMATESEDTNLIVYTRKRPLKYKDFSGTPDDLSIAAAVTYSGIHMQFYSQTELNHKTIKVVVTPYFMKDSWWRATEFTGDILDHEQLHFDITAIIACELVNNIRSRTFTPENFMKELQALQKQAEKDRAQMQQMYDKATEHGVNRPKQEEWSQKIKAQVAAARCY
jgi:hypothetical protein